VPDAKLPLLLALASLALPRPAGAQAVSLVHLTSIYEDEAGRPLQGPEGVACSADGRVVVADTGNARLVRLEYKARALSGGTEVKLAQIASPAAIQMDAKGNVLVLDRKARKIARIDAAGALQGFVEVKGASAPVMPGGFKRDEAGQIYLIDLAGVQVLVLDAGGTVSRQLALPREGMFTDLAVDPAGTLYAVDAAHSVIWSAERSATAFKALTKSMKELVHFPIAIAVSRGRLYVTDQFGHGLAVFGIDGSYQGRLLALGWGEGLVYYPAQVCIDDKDQLFLADRFNNRVQIFGMTAK
jgi:hypothetical protein